MEEEVFEFMCKFLLGFISELKDDKYSLLNFTSFSSFKNL